MQKLRPRPWGWLVLSVIVAGGCGAQPPEKAALARVGDRAITLAEFQRAFDEGVARGEGVTADTTSARRYLKDYITKTLLEQIATDSLEWTPLFEHRAVSFLENLMVQELRKDAYGHATVLSEADLRQVYEKGRIAYHYRALPSATRDEALQKLMSVREGAAFARMAERAPGGGDAGWHTAIDAPEAIIDELARLGPEEVGGPVEAEGQFWLVQFLEKSENPSLPPFEEVARSLNLMVARERGGRLLRTFRDELLHKYRYEPRMADVLWMTELLHEKTAHVSRTYSGPGRAVDGMPVSEEAPVWTENPIPEGDRLRVLATATADTIRAVLLLDHLMTKPSFSWPTFERPEELLQLMLELAISRLERVESWKRGYDQRPDLVWAAEKNRNLILTRQFIRNHIYYRMQPTPEEARDWYESQAAPGAVPGKRRYLLVTVATRELAEQAGRLLASVADPQAAFQRIQALDASASWTGPRGFPVVEAAGLGPIDREVFRLPQGGVTAPHPAGERFSVARVEEIQIASRGGMQRPFEEVKGEIMEQFAEARIDSVLNVYLAERRAATTIAVDQKVFQRIHYERPASGAVGRP